MSKGSGLPCRSRSKSLVWGCSLDMRGASKEETVGARSLAKLMCYELMAGPDVWAFRPDPHCFCLPS